MYYISPISVGCTKEQQKRLQDWGVTIADNFDIPVIDAIVFGIGILNKRCTTRLYSYEIFSDMSCNIIESVLRKKVGVRYPIEALDYILDLIEDKNESI